MSKNSNNSLWDSSLLHIQKWYEVESIVDNCGEVNGHPITEVKLKPTKSNRVRLLMVNFDEYVLTVAINSDSDKNDVLIRESNEYRFLPIITWDKPLQSNSINRAIDGKLNVNVPATGTRSVAEYEIYVEKLSKALEISKEMEMVIPKILKKYGEQ